MELNFKQKIILLLLKEENKKPMSPIQIMKSLFLYAQEEKPKDFYKFVSYLYGPCSFEVYLNLKKLALAGLISILSSKFNWCFYSITSKGEELLRDERNEKIERIKKFVTSKSFIELLKEIYSKYPQFTEKSIINKNFLKNL